jgi:hypothetical protein
LLASIGTSSLLDPVVAVRILTGLDDDPPGFCFKPPRVALGQFLAIECDARGFFVGAGAEDVGVVFSRERNFQRWAGVDLDGGRFWAGMSFRMP